MTAAVATVPRSRFSLGRWQFIGQRLGFYALTGWAAVTLNFVIPRFMPGDPAQSLIDKLQQQTGQRPSVRELEAIRRLYGDPRKDMLHQYFTYWSGLSHFNFGISISHYPTPVSTIVGQALPWTVVLVGATTIVAWILGTAIGVLMGWRPGRRFDSIFAPVTTFLHAIPAFWLGLLAFWFFAFRLGWFPLGGGYDPNIVPGFSPGFVLSTLRYGALPAVSLIFVGFNGWLFGMRNMMVTTISEDYVLLARAKGLSRLRVMFKYAARNAMLPNITGLALAIGSVIGGVLVTEVVFTYPGLGYVLFQAVQDKDFPVMQTIFLMITGLALLANFIADSLYMALDPRTRERGR
jgi:peptide/nickel transport system permease protein